MPTNWDDIWDYDTRFNPANIYPEPEQNMWGPRRDLVPQQSMFGPAQRVNNLGQAPQYDYNPMNKFTEYLQGEPMREDYRPGKFGLVLNSLAGGMEAMNSGSIGRGVQLGRALNERGYNDAYEGWKARGNPLKAAVEQENNRYRNVTTAYNQEQDNRRAERSVDIQSRNADAAWERINLQREQMQRGGWDLVDGPDGNQIRINKATGAQEATELPNAKLTAEQQVEQFNRTQQGLDRRHATPSGSSRLSSATSRANTSDTINFRRVEAEKDRDLRKWQHTTRSASMSEPKPFVDTPSSTRTAAGLMKAFPEFDDPELVTITGNKIDPKITDRAKFIAIIEKKANGDPNKIKELQQKWLQFKTRAEAFLPDEDD